MIDIKPPLGVAPGFIYYQDRISDLSKAITTIASVAPNLPKKSYDLEFKAHREKRSKNANDYSWVLQDKIAKALKRSVDDIHK